jgi:A/G-specific adenine glycosylase
MRNPQTGIRIILKQWSTSLVNVHEDKKKTCNIKGSRSMTTSSRVPSRKKTSPSSSQVRVFRRKVLAHYEKNGRDLPWRKKLNPYRVLVSEIMLQQTQVDRVIEKFKEFLAAFPDFAALAEAPLPQLLAIWSGLGYNRRALALKALAQKVVEDHQGRLPSDLEQLLTLPGIGKYTAGAVMAFAFNKPVVFMDTNIRRVYIHEFFQDQEGVHDDQLMPLVERTLDAAEPRTWYNALLDYGTVLKQQHANPNRRSAHYARQTPFENSNRQVRGKILKALVSGSPLTQAQLVKMTGMDQERVKKNLMQLCEEGFIKKKGKTFLV